jgi:3-hydroxyacyl-[acyl-carrier-protein] dehydratase
MEKPDLALLPHRPPFLFLDGIELDLPNQRIYGVWTAPADWDVFRGHFPGMPLVPGVILLEMMAQAACILGRRIDPSTADRPVLLVGLDNARFRRVIHPGERVETEVRFRRRRRELWRFDGEVQAGGEPVAEATILATLGELNL